MKRTTLIPIILLLLAAGVWVYVKFFTELLSKEDTYYSYFEKINGLQASSPVQLKGVKVGKVKEIDLNGTKNIRVVFKVDKKLKIPAGSTVTVGTGDISGTKTLKIVPGDGPGVIAPGSTVVAVTDTTMMEMFDAKITPALHNAKSLLVNADSGMKEFNVLINSGLGKRSQQEIINFNKQLENVGRLAKNMDQQTRNAGKAITKVDSMFARPGEKNRNINSALADGERQTQKLANTNYREELGKLNTNMDKLGNTFSQLKKNKLLTDKATYNNTSRQLDTLSRSVREAQRNPPDFITIGGGSKKRNRAHLTIQYHPPQRW